MLYRPFRASYSYPLALKGQNIIGMGVARSCIPSANESRSTVGWGIRCLRPQFASKSLSMTVGLATQALCLTCGAKESHTTMQLLQDEVKVISVHY